MKLSRKFTEKEAAVFSPGNRKVLDTYMEGIPDEAFDADSVMIELEPVRDHINHGVRIDGKVMIHRFSVCCDVETSDGNIDYQDLAAKTGKALETFGKDFELVKRTAKGWESA